MSSYLNREISEWNAKELASWLKDNKYLGISELFQKNSLNGYDLFYTTDDTLKNDFGPKFLSRKENSNENSQ